MGEAKRRKQLLGENYGKPKIFGNTNFIEGLISWISEENKGHEHQTILHFCYSRALAVENPSPGVFLMQKRNEEWVSAFTPLSDCPPEVQKVWGNADFTENRFFVIDEPGVNACWGQSLFAVAEICKGLDKLFGTF